MPQIDGTIEHRLADEPNGGLAYGHIQANQLFVVHVQMSEAFDAR